MLQRKFYFEDEDINETVQQFYYNFENIINLYEISFFRDAKQSNKYQNKIKCWRWSKTIKC